MKMHDGKVKVRPFAWRLKSFTAQSKQFQIQAWYCVNPVMLGNDNAWRDTVTKINSIDLSRCGNVKEDLCKS